MQTSRAPERSGRCGNGNLHILHIMVIKCEMQQLRDRRIQLLLTADELKAVDEWRFANKAPSRNDALRMLIRMALEAAKSK